MRKTIYSKCASERKKEYRIITSIIEDDGNRYVCKRALNEYAQNHINNMYEVYVKKLWKNKSLQLVPCHKGDKQGLVFEYLKGITLSEELELNAQKREWDAFKKKIHTFKEMICDVEEKVIFEYSEAFETQYGQIGGLEGYESARYLNVDLLPENIIIVDDIYYVIDYEWIMPFLVPIKYVLFRMLFFSPVFGKVPEEVRNEILADVEISKDEWKMFAEMELNFQARVADVSLDDLYHKMAQNVFYTDNQNIGLRDIKHIVAKDEAGNVLYNQFSRDLVQKVEFDAKENGKIRINLANDPCIIKIQNVLVEGEVKDDFEENCLLQIVDDYYFGENAEIRIDAKKGEKIGVEYLYFDKNADTLVELAVVLKDKNRLQLENLELEKWNSAYQISIKEKEAELLNVGEERNSLVHRIDELTKQILQVGNERGALQEYVNKLSHELATVKQEIEVIKTSRGWKLYSKINKLD